MITLTIQSLYHSVRKPCRPGTALSSMPGIGLGWMIRPLTANPPNTVKPFFAFGRFIEDCDRCITTAIQCGTPYTFTKCRGLSARYRRFPDIVIAMNGPWLTVADVADELGLSEPTVRRMVVTGRLPALKFSDRSYSVDPAELAQFIQKSRTDSGDVAGGAAGPEGNFEDAA